MQIKIFTIPMTGDENSALTDELNGFLRSYKVFRTVRRFIPNDD